MKIKLSLIGIILIAFFIRFYNVTSNPPSLNWDEVSIGYNAYSILKTGKDEWGKTLPIHFKSYGEYKLPAQIYASIPGIAIFGLNELGVRITPVVYGTLTILIIFLLTQALFKKPVVSLMAAFLLAISPWHIQLTRASFESSFATFWVSLGVLMLVKGFEKKHWFLWSMIPFAISVYTYNTARIFTPLFLFVVLQLYFRQFLKIKSFVLGAMMIFFALMVPLVPFYLSGEGNARYKLVSITDDPGLIPRINENRGNTHLPEPLPRLIHNKVTYVGFYFMRNYLAHFTPDFLFINGAPHKQHHVQGLGELYLFQAPFLLLGLFFLFKDKQKFKGILFAWVLLAFIPVAATQDSIPHALRPLIAVPVYQIITALGIYKTFVLLNNKKPYFKYALGIAIVAVGIWNFTNYLNQYFLVYPQAYSKDWQYGYKQVVEYIKEHGSEYDQIVFTRHYGEPHMFTLFYLQYDPASFQNNSNLQRFETHDWIRVLSFDKFYFPDLGDKDTAFQVLADNRQGKKMLFIGKPGDFPKDTHKLEKVNFLNGDPVFEVVEVK